VLVSSLIRLTASSPPDATCSEVAKQLARNDPGSGSLSGLRASNAGTANAMPSRGRGLLGGRPADHDRDGLEERVWV
jgi:hypothetical protein